MSKPYYKWWGYMKAISREYYARKGKELHGTEKREQEAVEAAIDQTLDLPDGSDRIEVVKMVLLKNTHRIPGAAMEIPCSERTAAQWHGDFIKLVAKNYGLLDESLHKKAK